MSECYICGKDVNDIKLSEHVKKCHPKSQLPKDGFMICTDETHKEFNDIKTKTTLLGYVTYIENDVNINPDGNWRTTNYTCGICDKKYTKHERYGEYYIIDNQIFNSVDRYEVNSEIYNSFEKEYKGVVTMSKKKVVEPKHFRIFNIKTKKIKFMDFNDLPKIKPKDDITVTTFTGRKDGNNIALYEGDIIQIISYNEITDKEVSTLGIIEYVPNYAAYGVMFESKEPKLLFECFNDKVLYKSNVFEEI